MIFSLCVKINFTDLQIIYKIDTMKFDIIQ